MTTIITPPPCLGCKHMGKGRYCAAYTRKPIPLAIWTGGKGHDALRGDEDVKKIFEAKGQE